jgi:hypothetical protein
MANPNALSLRASPLPLEQHENHEDSGLALGFAEYDVLVAMVKRLSASQFVWLLLNRVRLWPMLVAATSILTFLGAIGALGYGIRSFEDKYKLDGMQVQLDNAQAKYGLEVSQLTYERNRAKDGAGQSTRWEEMYTKESQLAKKHRAILRFFSVTQALRDLPRNTTDFNKRDEAEKNVTQAVREVVRLQAGKVYKHQEGQPAYFDFSPVNNAVFADGTAAPVIPPTNLPWEVQLLPSDIGN